jgi:plastocyanin
MRSTWTRGLVVVGAALVLLAAACGGDDGGDAYVEPKGPAGVTVKLESGNTYFDPDEVDAPSGIIAIDLTNVESGIHDLVIRDVPGFQVEVSGKGDEVTKKVELEPGEYEFYCTVPGHEEAGMKGTLTVS